MHNNTKAWIQSSSQHANTALNPRQISPCSGDTPSHLSSVWLVSGIHLQMHTCLVLFHGCYSLIRFFVQLSYPQCLRLHQAPVSGCLITECIHLHYSALSVEACSSTSELCQEVLRNWSISLHSDPELLPPLILVALIKLLACGFQFISGSFVVVFPPRGRSVVEPNENQTPLCVFRSHNMFGEIRSHVGANVFLFIVVFLWKNPFRLFSIMNTLVGFNISPDKLRLQITVRSLYWKKMFNSF